MGNLIKDAKTFQIPSIMQTGRNVGMRLMDDSLMELFTNKKDNGRGSGGKCRPTGKIQGVARTGCQGAAELIRASSRFLLSQFCLLT